MKKLLTELIKNFKDAIALSTARGYITQLKRSSSITREWKNEVYDLENWNRRYKFIFDWIFKIDRLPRTIIIFILLYMILGTYTVVIKNFFSYKYCVYESFSYHVIRSSDWILTKLFNHSFTTKIYNNIKQNSL